MSSQPIPVPAAPTLTMLPRVAPALHERPADVALDVCAKWGVTWEAVHGRARTKLVATTRAALVRELRRRSGMGVMEIAAFLGRDHTTVSYLAGNRRRAR